MFPFYRRESGGSLPHVPRISLSLCGPSLLEWRVPCGADPALWPGLLVPEVLSSPLLSEGNFPGLAPKLAWLPPHL